MPERAHNAAGAATSLVGWLATVATGLAAITPGQVKEWAALLQVLAFGAFMAYLELRKRWEAANRESLLYQIDGLKDELAEAKAKIVHSDSKIDRAIAARKSLSARVDRIEGKSDHELTIDPDTDSDLPAAEPRP